MAACKEAGAARSLFNAVETTPVRWLWSAAECRPRARRRFANSLRIDDTRHRVAKLNIIVSNRVAADDAAFRFGHLRKAAANNLFENLRITLVGKPTIESAETGLPPMA